jgi:hypothetical protein
MNVTDRLKGAHNLTLSESIIDVVRVWVLASKHDMLLKIEKIDKLSG